MKLHSLKIEGFRKHYNTEIYFDDATFLIGENNIGKSSALAAIKYLLSDTKSIGEAEFFAQRDSEGDTVRICKEIILTAEFRNLPDEALNWRGFKGRIIKFKDGEDNTNLKVVYRKTFKIGESKCKIEMLEYVRTLKSEFEECKTLTQLIENGIDEAIINDVFKNVNKDKVLSAAEKKNFINIEELYDIDENQEVWIENPGGIPGNVLSRLPKFLLIPAEDRANELSGSNGTLIKTLEEIFTDVRDKSQNYKDAQRYLELLASELNPEDENSDLGIMMKELNSVLGDVFPNAGINAIASLSDADAVIKPKFTVSMYSNVDTEVSLQGTGMIRASVFALLRYKSERDLKKVAVGEYVRPVIIGFEEPEIYLHPSASTQMKDTIYRLASTKVNQIVCTTHSPYMIDLSKKPCQVLNNLSERKKNITLEGEQKEIICIKSNPFNISEAFKEIADNERQYIKMLVKIDHEISKIFFAEKILIVEGDTEGVVLAEAIDRLPECVKKGIKSKWQIIKARGKAVIISLVNYLKAMGINPIVIHDKDTGTAGAEIFNQPIADAVGCAENLYVVENCIEDLLGYRAPTSEKPFTAYKYIKENWGSTWDSISSDKIKELIERVFDEEFNKYEEMGGTDEAAAIIE